MTKFIIVISIMVFAAGLSALMLWRETRKLARAEDARAAAKKPGPALRWHSYAELPLGVYMRVFDAVDGAEPEDGIPRMLAALCGVTEEEIDALTLPEYTALVAEADWVQRDPKPVQVRRTYWAGPDFPALTLFRDFTRLSFGQYIDLQELMKNPDLEVSAILSVALVPAGHAYTDGYDVADLRAAIEKHLSILDALAIRDFFVTRLNRLTRRFLTCSAGMMREKARTAKTPEAREKALKAAEAIRKTKEDLRRSGDGLQPWMTSPTLPVAVGRMLLKSLQ